MCTFPRAFSAVPYGFSAPECEVCLSDNKLLLEGNAIELNALSDGLRDLIYHTDITSLEIKGDSTSHLGTFIAVIETARECGIIDLGYHKKDAPAK